ncbi:MAG: type II toxin-antitoxin system RelE/ParE family toxin [Devosia sp.]|nr:type II toxin-antitoxin system RelE/ParE family toxin [Devosia sp.]
MPREIEYGPHPRRDLYEIWAYVASDNPSAADKLIARFTETFKALAVNPMLGRSRDELRAGLRSLPQGRYVVFCRQEGRSLQILRILSSYRHVGAEFFS